MLFAGAFLVLSGLTLLAARVSHTEFDLDRLFRDARRLDDSVPDGGASVAADEEMSD